MAKPERCIVYIDGYNFYYAVKRHPAATPIYLGWCDFEKLARLFMLPPGSVLEGIQYFTAPVEALGEVGGPAGSERARQAIWLSAVRTIPGLRVIEGYHRGDRPRARREKQTDVNIAVNMLADAAQDQCDRPLLITADLDQVPAIRAVTERFQKKVDVWLPPNMELRSWSFVNALAGVCVRSITPRMLQAARLKERIEHGGMTIEAPRMWRHPADPKRG